MTNSLLPAMMILPLLTALAVALSNERRARAISAVGSLLGVVLAIVAMGVFDWGDSARFQLSGSADLIAPLGIRLSFGVDSVALWLVVLTQLLQPLCVFGSFSAINNRVRSYYAWLMALQAAMVGVFVAQDLLFFYVSFEFTLLPMFVLIHMYGSTNRRKAAIKFFLYTFFGSIIALAGLVYVAFIASQQYHEWTFDIARLEAAARTMSPRQQAWVLGAMMAGFAVKVPLFPFHTWLPLAHTEAPTAGSVILAGVLLKLGTYAIWRFVLPFVPVAVVEYAPLIAGVSIVGILYCGLICWVQRDVKRLVAYSSVAHLGFAVLGLFALNTVGAAGSVLYMINHGLSTGALFFCIGFMYERYHTRNMDEVGGLVGVMPVWSFFVGFFAMASVGLPGLNGFVSEFMCLLGTFQSGADDIGLGGTAGGPLGPWYAAIAAVGMIVAAMYLLLMVGKMVFGPARQPPGHHDHPTLPRDLGAREIGILSVLAAACLFLGVYPTPVLRSLEAPVGQAIAAVNTARQSQVAIVMNETSVGLAPSPLAGAVQSERTQIEEVLR